MKVLLLTLISGMKVAVIGENVCEVTPALVDVNPKGTKAVLVMSNGNLVCVKEKFDDVIKELSK